MIESERRADLSEVIATLRQECEPPALSEERALQDSAVELPATDELMEQIVDPANLDRAWRQVKRNRSRVATDAFEPPGPTESRSKTSNLKPERSGQRSVNNCSAALTGHKRCAAK